MNILYVCHRFPFPPKRGGKIRPFNMIQHFHKKGHKVWVNSLVRTEEEQKETAGIEEFCHEHFMAKVDDKVQTAKMILRLPTLIPSSMGFFHSTELKQQINKLLATVKFDLIFVHCSSVAQYVENVTDIPKILDYGDMDSQKWLSYTSFKPFPINLGYWLEGTKMEREEKRLAKKFTMGTATTKMEWKTLDDYQTGITTDWFPNGVNAEFFKPDGEGYNPKAISFIGRMDYYPNQECMFDFCKNVLPLIKAVVPDVELFIVGAEPTEKVKALGNIDGVTVTGSVDDVRPYILRTAAMVAPLNIARGTQNKILEAMAMGVPVVSSEMAAGGIDAVDGEHFLTANSPKEYAEALIKLMQNSDERERLSILGRERVLTNHDWQNSMKRLEAIVDKCIAQFSQ
jgi:sugar transferase (PEP-CTERM/EpsH1 system associated)